MIQRVWKCLAIAAIISSLALVGCDRKKDASAPDETASAPTSSAPAVNLQEGEWQITMKVEMPGMPAEAMKPHSIKTCINKSNYVPETNPGQSDCKMEDQKIDGNTVSWTMACKDTKGKGTITYSGDSMEGLIESTTKVGGREINTKMAMNGKRLGPCESK